MQLSIIICTLNRAADLARALDGLAGQTVPFDQWELLVIDNGSTDHTPDLLAGFADRLPNLRVIPEPVRGLSNARNTGWHAARGRYVGYLDDDAIPPPEWVAVALRVIADPAPEAFGGPYTNYYVTPKPEWFHDHYQALSWGETARTLKDDEWLAGLNLFFRRDVIERLGGFNPQLGMNGAALAYGEETLMIKQIRGAGGTVWYEPDLHVRHLCPPRKLTVLWWLQAGYAMGRDEHMIFRRLNPGAAYRPVAGVCWVILRVAIGILMLGTVGCLLRDRRRYPAWQNYYVEHLQKYCTRLGTNVAALSHQLQPTGTGTG